MRTNISAIIFDPHKNEHDYSTIDGILTGDNNVYQCSIYENTDDLYGKLNENRGFDCLVTIGQELDFTQLNVMPYEYRKRWVHFETFIPDLISSAIRGNFVTNLNAPNLGNHEKVFSIFTSTYNTGRKEILRLYNSLVCQTYENWNWFIIDDSTNGHVQTYIEELNDPRIFFFKNVSNHGNIGFNKHMIAMMATGDFLVEMDHDDELVPECLELLHEAFEKFNADFVFSDALELVDGTAVNYGDNFSFGQGIYRAETVNGKDYVIAVCTPTINPKSVRGIYALPNHVRSWRKDFYHKIGGHNPQLSVLDDMDILIRTFLHGKMAKVNKVLYIQYEDGRWSGNGTTQQKRFNEIQRTNWILYAMYDKQIHDRIIELGYEDTIWNEDAQCSMLGIDTDNLPQMNDQL